MIWIAIAVYFLFVLPIESKIDEILDTPSECLLSNLWWYWIELDFERTWRKELRNKIINKTFFSLESIIMMHAQIENNIYNRRKHYGKKEQQNDK